MSLDWLKSTKGMAVIAVVVIAVILAVAWALGYL